MIDEDDILKAQLLLENERRGDHNIKIFGDIVGYKRYVGLSVKYKDKDVNLLGGEHERFSEDYEDEQEYFHLNKFQVDVLISFLKKLRNHL